MKNIDLLLKLGKISAANGQNEKAIDSYEQILALDLGCEEAAEALVEILVGRKAFEKAIDVISLVIEHARSTSAKKKFHRSLGDLYLKLGNHRKAIEAFEILNKLGPDTTPNPVGSSASRTAETPEDTPSIWNEFGLVMNKVGSYDDAVEAFEKGIALDPNIPYLHLNLAQVLVLQGKFSEALDHFDSAFESTEDNEGRVAILKRMISVFKQEGRAEMVELANQVITAISVAISKHNGGYMVLPISSINKPTGELDEENLRDMVESIRAHGIIQPLVISPENGSQQFNIVAGKKRYYAAKLAGLEHIPAIVREVTEIESIELSFHENLHNNSADPERTEEAYQILSSNYNLSIEGIARTTGASTFSVANRMKAVGVRSSAETLKDAREEKTLVEKLIGSLKTDSVENREGFEEPQQQTGFELNEELLEDANPSGALWYMEQTPANVITGPTKVNFTSLFSRASGILKANPQHQNVSA